MSFAARWCSLLGIFAFALGCVARPSTGRSPAATSVSGNSLVTAAELSRYAAGTNLLDALRRLRPNLLRSRGTSALVSIDGTAPTDQGVLSFIPVSTVAEVRLLRATNSVGKPAIVGGKVVLGDVLLVVTHK
jgi:hypothetical protein